MTGRRMITIDGNEAAASVAYRASEVIAIYPITPSSTMGELADEWSAHRRPNLWGTVPQVVEMQSEGGAAGAVHGALQAGALTTTFTASQGLLLMIPNLYKIAGELTSFAMHVSARTLATHALSIFGDHSDVMAARQTGFALLASGSVQEAHDLAAIAHAATLAARVPFLHFFDGFRTSHEVSKIEELTDDDLRALLADDLIAAHRARALSPDRPVLRGTAQNPDTYFQAREAANPYYLAVPLTVRQTMDRFAHLTGRHYRLFEYFGDPEAERIIVVMGSAAETVRETAASLNAHGERVGVLTVRLFRPFSITHFIEALPRSVRSIAVLDRTKEPGALGEPLYQDVMTALGEARSNGHALPPMPRVIGGRYGLSSKEFTPAMVKAVFDELSRPRPKTHFTVGITDDVTGASVPVDTQFSIEADNVTRCVFYGLGADGTVSANKNSIKIIGEETENFAQGYFVYDSKKSGQVTISHLRFGPHPIRAPYLISQANFVACHQFMFMDRYRVLESAAPGAVFLLNAPFGPDQVFDRLPYDAQEEVIRKRLRMYVIDAAAVAKQTGMGGRINSIMQTAFFAISGVLPRDEAITKIKAAILKTYGRKGDDVVRANFEAVDATLANLHAVVVPNAPTASRRFPPMVGDEAPDFVQRVTAVMLARQGDLLPVSAFPADGTWPAATSQWEKRNITDEIPVWDPAICIQCNKCTLICPHAAIRAKVAEPALLADAPPTLKAVPYRGPEFKAMQYLLQVAPEDCTGCSLCVEVCPVTDKKDPSHKAIDMAPQMPLREAERENFAFFMSLPDPDRTRVRGDVKGTQFLRPLFEFSGACAGCGETPYLKLLTQLYGDRVLIANATGCSSIYGANLPTAPYAIDACGRGPAWSNSLFEDNAEFGFGFRLAIDSQTTQAQDLLRRLSGRIGDRLVEAMLSADQSSEAGIIAQRDRVQVLRGQLADLGDPEARRLDALADFLVRKSVWIVGGDGWAYDIGYGGLDHVLAMGRDVNILVLDTEVYSNTGGQQSKATPLGAAAKFAVAGKAIPKKDLGLLAMAYGTAYVAKVAIGAKDLQTVQAFREADSFPGTSLIIAYGPCIEHGYDLRLGAEHEKLAVESGYWPLYRHDPRRVERGLPALQMDSPAPKLDVAEFMAQETRFRMVESADPDRARALVDAERREIARRYSLYAQLAAVPGPANSPKPPEGAIAERDD